MTVQRIADNTKIPADQLEQTIPDILSQVCSKPLSQLAAQGILIYPPTIQESEDLTRTQSVLRREKGSYLTGNVMGFLGSGTERLIITSRFCRNEQDYLLHYLLERVLNIPNIVSLETGADLNRQMYHLPALLFPAYFRAALRKGLFKTYIRRQYNDQNPRGLLDIPRHLRENTPFLGRVAYNCREYSYDNAVTELIRHTVEYLRGKPYGPSLLATVRQEVRQLQAATPGYHFHDRRAILLENRKKPLRHAYYQEYRTLQQLCLMILSDREIGISGYGQKMHGILFDGAWLWEEYVNTLIADQFHHPRNKGATTGGQRLFYDADSDKRDKGLIYPDFIGKDPKHRIIADAKYKPHQNIGNHDYLQLLAYMFRFDAKAGWYLYPEAVDAAKDTVFQLNQGCTYDPDPVTPRKDVHVTKHGLKIPADAVSYQDFCQKMAQQEQVFRAGLADFSQPPCPTTPDPV